MQKITITTDSGDWWLVFEAANRIIGAAGKARAKVMSKDFNEPTSMEIVLDFYTSTVSPNDEAVSIANDGLSTYGGAHLVTVAIEPVE
jgi:hypothetical protein